MSSGKTRLAQERRFEYGKCWADMKFRFEVILLKMWGGKLRVALKSKEVSREQVVQRKRRVYWM